MPYTVSVDTVASNAQWVDGGSANEARFLLLSQVSEDTITTARRGQWSRTTSAGTTPTAQTPEKTQTRSPAYTGNARSAFSGAPTVSANPLLVAPGIPTSLRTIWRPPRPWAAPVVNNGTTDQISTTGNLAVVRQTLSLFDYRGGTEQMADIRRRPRRAGFWHYANNDTKRQGQSTRQRSDLVQWVAFTNRARRVEYQNTLALMLSAAGGGNVTISAVAAVANAVAPAPVPGVGISPSAGVATASAPVSTPGVTVSPSAAVANASAPVPTLNLSSGVTTPPAIANASMPAPSVVTGINITVVPAVANATRTAPGLSLGGSVVAPAALATATRVAPTVSASGAVSVTILSVPAMAFATRVPPRIVKTHLFTLIPDTHGGIVLRPDESTPPGLHPVEPALGTGVLTMGMNTPT